MHLTARLLPLTLALVTLLGARIARAGNSTDTLPKGIFGIRVNSVYVTGVDYQFGPDGGKATIGDLHAVSIRDQAAHTVLDSDIGKLIFNQVKKALQNTPGGAFGISLAESAFQSMDLGTMKTNITPSVQVTAPTVMYGITNHWNVIVTAPIVKMRTDVSFDYKPGTATAVLDQASALANAIGITSIPNSSQFVSLAQQSLSSRGYKPLESEEKTFLGDVRVMNLFRLGKVGNLSFGGMNTIGLPTGPSHDSDDLLDPGAFHHTFIAQEFTTVYKVSKNFETYASAGVQYNLPEQTNFRIPLDSSDLEPDASQKEDVTRQLGFGKFVESGVKYRALPRFVLVGGLCYRTKDADHFEGDRGLNYAALEQQFPYTSESATSYKLGLTYDPLSNYRMGSIPLMVDLNYEETIAGVNTPGLKQIMFALSTFF